MIVKDERVLKQFVDHGLLVTQRNFPYKEGNIWINKQHKGFVIAVLQNREAFRDLLVEHSGFATRKEWDDVAIKLHGSIPKWLVCVAKGWRVKK